MHEKEIVKFIITFTRASQWNLPWARWVKSKFTRFIYSRFILTPFSQLRLGQGWRTYGTCAQNVTRKNFLGTWHSPLYNFFPIFQTCAYICEEHVYTHTYVTVYRQHHKHDCYQITLRMKNFYTNRERCEVLTGYLSLRRWSGGDWAITWHWTESFKILSSNRRSRQPHLLPQFLPHRFPSGDLYWKYHNYTVH